MPESRKPLRELFNEALAIEDTQERAAYLKSACGTDASLRKQIEGLIQADAQAGGFLGASSSRAEPQGTQSCPPSDGDADRPPSEENDCSPSEKPGDRIGRYKLLEKVGEGGWGVVYVAEQTEPVRRRIALKVIKLGMDTREVIARFEAERQALAMMDHPNIAKVLDAATTDTGRPYFVMELVRGIRITEYCDQAQLSTKERLDLFINVCHAIQHAHQKGIIHRDIKPSNILVTLHDGVAVPKVIDFGIAKATEGRLSEQTVYTQLNQFIGTPAYMSPEQAEMSGLDIDTRSDIYGLGVLLYQLLTGKTPFDGRELRDMGLDAMRKTIREKEPLRPSTRLATMQGEELTTTAKRRSADAPKLIHLLKGDLDWIVMKCLEKDRARRYSTANGLAMDITRYLQSEPVVARPPSSFYRFRKLARRNKLIFATGTAVAAALVAGIAMSTWQATMARRARNAAVKAHVAESEQRRAAQVALAQAKAEGARADRKANEARLNLYAADMKLAQLALAKNDLGRTVEYLQNHKPGPGESDDRGFEWRYLWQQAQGQEIASLRVTNARINALDFSPNGRWLAVASSRGATIVEVATWREKVVLAETNALLAIQFSPDGESLLTSGKVGVRVWDTLTWQPRQELGGASGLASFSPDGLILVTLGLNGLQVWDAHSLRLLHQFFGLSLRLQWDFYGNLAFSRDGRSMAALVEEADAATNRASIRIWDVDHLRMSGSAASPRILQFPEVGSVAALALSEDGRRLAVSTVLGQLSVWDTSTGTRLASHRELAQRSYGLQYRASDGCLTGVCSDQTLRTWRQEGANLVETSLRKGHLAEVSALAVMSNGAYLATGDIAGAVKLWDDADAGPGIGAVRDVHGNEVLPDHFNLLDFLSDHRTLVALAWRRTPSRVSDKANELITGGVLDFWDIDARRPRRTFSNVEWHAAARVSPDQRWVAIARTNGPVELLDVARPGVVATLRGHTNEVRRIYFTPDNRRVVTATVRQLSAQGDALTDDSWVRLWEVPSGRLLRETNLQAAICSIAMAPDGETFAVHPAGGQVEMRQTSDFARLFALPIRHGSQSKLAFSPDGRLLAASLDGEIDVWNLPARRLQFVRPNPLNINWLTFAPDGRTLASASDDRTVKLWNVTTGQEMVTLPFSGGCFQAEFSGDGRTLAVATYRIQGTNASLNVHLLRAPSLAEIAAAEGKESRDFRDHEPQSRSSSIGPGRGGLLPVAP